MNLIDNLGTSPTFEALDLHEELISSSPIRELTNSNYSLSNSFSNYLQSSGLNSSSQQLLTIEEVDRAISYLSKHGIEHPSLDADAIDEISTLQQKLFTMDSSKHQIDCPVIIIGGGISGQYSAFILSKLGFNNITILEKNNIIDGGRCNSVILNGEHCFPGAMRIPQDNFVGSLFDYLDISVEPFYNDTPTSIVLSVDDAGNANALTKSEALQKNILPSDTSSKWQEELRYISSMLDDGHTWHHIITTLGLDKYTFKEYLQIERNWSDDDYKQWIGSPLGHYDCFEKSGVVAFESIVCEFLTYKRNSQDYLGIDDSMSTLKDMSELPKKIAKINLQNGVKIECNNAVDKVSSSKNGLAVSYGNNQTKECSFCFDTTPPKKKSNINISCSQKIFIDVSFPDGHILSKSSGSIGKFCMLENFQQFFSDEGFGELYIFKHIGENRAILMAYSWDAEAQNTFLKKKDELPHTLFKALAMPIPGANNAVMPDLIFNGGVATPVEQAFRMTSKKDLDNGLKFSPVNRLENPYISTFSEEGSIPGFFCENEWVSMGSGFIMTALFTSLKFALEAYKLASVDLKNEYTR
jgi:Flavin containing amine oxidoreductase